MENRDAAGAYLEVRGLVKRFGDDRAVDDISFAIPRGYFLTLLGPSGCGKTTTLMSIAGLHRIDAGSISVGGTVYTSPADGIFLPPEKRDIGMVFQSYAIWPHMTVVQNVAYPLEIRKVARGEIDDRVADVLRLVGLTDMAGSSPRSFRAASSSAPRSPARSSRIRGCCCSMNRCPISI